MDTPCRCGDIYCRRSWEPISREEVIERLLALQASSDHEQAHIEADHLLLRYISDDTLTDAYMSLTRWYT